MDDDVRIIHGDCLEVMQGMATGSVDLVITSPPYNLGGEPWPHLGNWKPGDAGTGSRSKWRNGSDACGGIAYGVHEDAMPHEDYVCWQRSVLSECWRLLGPKGAIFYNHKPRVIGGRLWTPLELNPGLPLRQIVIWARSGGLNYNPTAFVSTHEWIMILAKDGFRLRDRAASGLGDVWQVRQEGGKNPHPAPFPVAIPARILAAMPADCTRILDPFAGSGSTGVACLKAGRRCVLIEVDARYIPVIERRVEAARTPLFAGLASRPPTPEDRP